MNTDQIRRRFADFLAERGLRLTRQRARILDVAFATHDHFTAEGFLALLAAAEGDVGAAPSRATVYRTLGLMVEGGFLELLDAGKGEALYEHVLGHRHHDHLICTVCGRIEEFFDPRIEALQEEVAAARGFTLEDHDLRLLGRCRKCRKGD